MPSPYYLLALAAYAEAFFLSSSLHYAFDVSRKSSAFTTNINFHRRCFSRRQSHRPPMLQMSGSAAGEMQTNYEWLLRQRMDETVSSSQKKILQNIEWMEIADTSSDSAEESASDVKEDVSDQMSSYRVPLYPLNAVHLPSDNMQMLNNIEPQNVRMAKDLADGARPKETNGAFLGQQVAIDEETHNNEAKNKQHMLHGRFCVTLRAADTGRISRIGTLMRVVSTEEMKSYDGNLLGIKVICVGEKRVRIDRIANPECWSRENRIKRSDEYLVADVRPFDDTKATTQTDIEHEKMETAIAQQLEEDFAAVRSMYSSKDGVAANELPPWAVDAARDNLPHLQARNFTQSENLFWKAADVWQSLCNTVREARRSNLRAEVNERTIDAAIKKGGMLKLPVHRTDLPQQVQIELNQMEKEAANEFVEKGMDPVIDFEALLSCNCHIDRLRYLSRMISRERRRLETKMSLKDLLDGASGGDAESNGRMQRPKMEATLNGTGLINITSIFE